MEIIKENITAGAEALPLVEIRMQRWATVTCSSSDGMNHMLSAEQFAGKTYREGIIESLGGVSISVQGGSVHGELRDGEGKTVASTLFTRDRWVLERVIPAGLPALDRRLDILVPHAAMPTLGGKPRVRFGRI